MKKVVSFAITLVLIFSLAGCTESTVNLAGTWKLDRYATLDAYGADGLAGTYASAMLSDFDMTMVLNYDHSMSISLKYNGMTRTASGGTYKVTSDEIIMMDSYGNEEGRLSYVYEKNTMTIEIDGSMMIMVRTAA